MKRSNVYKATKLLYLSAFIIIPMFFSAQQSCNNADPGPNPGDTSCVTFIYNNQEVTYTTVRADDGNIWLQQNLGSSKVATSITDAASYGDLFQWGRWDDGHQLRNSSTVSVPATNDPTGLPSTGEYIIGATSSNGWWVTSGSTDSWAASNMSQISANNGLDPCKAIDNAWRMPTEIDWTNVRTAETIMTSGSAFASNLKLPASGIRNAVGTLLQVGAVSYFWTANSGNGNARLMYIMNGLASNSNSVRGQGAAVRCVKESSALSVNDFKKETIGIYPNPTSGIVNIKTDSGLKNIAVYNVLGQKISPKIEDNKIDFSEFPQGVYILDIVFENGQKISKKVIKN